MCALIREFSHRTHKQYKDTGAEVRITEGLFNKTTGNETKVKYKTRNEGGNST